MTGVVEEFVRSGFVAVEGALDPAFCESVVADAFGRMGMVESEPLDLAGRARPTSPSSATGTLG